MDGLFEEKYRLGKESNDLKATQAKIQAMLQEALAENEIHRRTQGALYNPLPPSLEALAEIRSKLLPVSGGADPAPETLKTPSAPLQIPPALRATQVDDYVALARPDVIVSPYLSLLGEIQAQQERNLLENLARQRLAGHLFASQPPLGGFGVQGNFSHLL